MVKNDKVKNLNSEFPFDLGKLLESIILNHVLPTINKLLPGPMHEFRPYKGTETGMTSLLEDIKAEKKIESRNHCSRLLGYSRPC